MSDKVFVRSGKKELEIEFVLLKGFKLAGNSKSK